MSTLYICEKSYHARDISFKDTIEMLRRCNSLLNNIPEFEDRMEDADIWVELLEMKEKLEAIFTNTDCVEGEES